MRILTRGLGGAAYYGMVTVGLGPLILEVVRIIRGGRSVVRDIYGDRLEEFKIAISLVALNGKDILKPIFNKRRYQISEAKDVNISVSRGHVKQRKSRGLIDVIAETIKVRRGYGED